MTISRKGLILLILLVAIAAVIGLQQERPALAESELASPARPRSTYTGSEERLAHSQDSEQRRIPAEWAVLLKWLASDPPPSAEEVRDRLTSTRIGWTELDPQVRADAIRQLLESGEDAVTGLEFQVGNHGLLAGWPTLRVFLLDVLATSDPQMAASIANQLLDTTTSPDEFATGLRSLTRDGPGRADDGELLSRFGQMLGREDWQTSRGFAEALDLAREIGSPDAARALANWNGKPILRSMSLDEFAAEHPEAIMEILAEESTLDGPAGATLMARANPEIPGQLAAVDAYLRSPDRSPEEAATFLKSFPLRSATTGYRLYGKTPAPYHFEQIKSGDLAAACQVEIWLGDPDLENYRPELTSLQERLSEWVEQAK